MGKLLTIPSEISADYDLVDSTLLSKEREFLTEIGDDKEPLDFFPQVKIKRWENESNFSMRLHQAGNVILNHRAGVVTTEQDKLIWTGDGVRSEFRRRDLYGRPALQWTQVVPSRPLANNIKFTIQSKGLKFWYQPIEVDPPTVKINPPESSPDPFTSIRPDHIKGSYAVYHESKKHNEYKTGKAFHLYRPRITDDNGDAIWGELDINEQSRMLTINIDSQWLNNAVYPIRVA